MTLPNTRPVVLAIDDNIDTHRLLAVRLRSDEFTLKSAMSYDEGEKMMTAITPAAILLDLDMPGVDGFAALRILKGRPATQRIPVIVMTAMSSGQVKARVMELGAADFVSKPFNPAELSSKLNSALNLTFLIEETSRRRAAESRTLRSDVCFISFSMADIEFAKALDIRLRYKGATTWFSPEDLGGGASAFAQVRKTPGPTDRTILILSEASMSAGWTPPLVRRELGREQRAGRPLLYPVRITGEDRVTRWQGMSGLDYFPASSRSPFPAADFTHWNQPEAFERCADLLLNRIASHTAQSAAA